MPEIEIEIDEVARKEGLEAIKKDTSPSVWAGVIIFLIEGVDLAAFLKEHGDERVSPYTIVREYLEVLKLCGHLVEKEGRTFIKADVLKGLPTFQKLVSKDISLQG